MKKFLLVTIPIILLCMVASFFLKNIEIGGFENIKEDSYNAYYYQEEFLGSEFFVYERQESAGNIIGNVQTEACDVDMAEYDSFYHKDLKPCACFKLSLPIREWQALTNNKPYFKASFHISEVIIEKDGRFYGFTYADSEKVKPEKIIKRAITDISRENVGLENMVEMTNEEIKEYLKKYDFVKK